MRNISIYNCLENISKKRKLPSHSQDLTYSVRICTLNSEPFLGLYLYCYNVDCFRSTNIGAVEIAQWLEVSTQERPLRIWGCIPSTHRNAKGAKKIWCLEGRYRISIPRASCRTVLAVISGLNGETLPQGLRR